LAAVLAQQGAVPDLILLDVRDNEIPQEAIGKLVRVLCERAQTCAAMQV
jgi:hypothetical protein